MYPIILWSGRVIVAEVAIIVAKTVIEMASKPKK